jgi:ADP-heptose:LPS heptosyltransferase
VVRYGAFGDMLQASSVFAGLHQAGYHVTVYATPPGSDVCTHDPHVDEWILQDKDQVPNDKLGEFWESIAKKYDRFVNLSESVEDTWIASHRKVQFRWPPALRHAHLNQNYLEHQHDLAQIPHEPAVRFYPTADEAAWASREKARMGGLVVLWSLAGSSRHKTWPYLDNIIALLMLEFPGLKVVLVGDQAGQLLERGWEKEPRVFRRSGIWPIRKSMAFAQVADVVIGPETGILNSVACEAHPKVIFLSHSTHENLTRDWVNTHVLASEATSCPGRGENAAPACHQLHYDWSACKRAKDAAGEDMGVAQCQADISAEQAGKVIWHVVTWELERREGKRA